MVPRVLPKSDDDNEYDDDSHNDVVNGGYFDKDDEYDDDIDTSVKGQQA